MGRIRMNDPEVEGLKKYPASCLNPNGGLKDQETKNYRVLNNIILKKEHLTPAKRANILFWTAKIMLNTFGLRPWMSQKNVYGSSGERINDQGNIITAAYSRG